MPEVEASVAGGVGARHRGAETQAFVNSLEGPDAHPRDLYPVVVAQWFYDGLLALNEHQSGRDGSPGSELTRELLDRSKKAVKVVDSAQMRRELRSCVPDEVLRAAVDEWDSLTDAASFSESLTMVGRPGTGRGSWRWVFIFQLRNGPSAASVQRRIEVATSGRRRASLV